jgi:hypothetical protein
MIFVPRHIVNYHPTKLGSIVQHGASATQKSSLVYVNRPLKSIMVDVLAALP